MDYLTVKDVAELVRRNEETIRRMIRARKLDVTLDNNNRHQGYQIPVDELTRTWAITREEVERYIDRRRAQEQQAGETRLPLGPERAHTAVDAPPDAGDTPPVKGVAAGDGLSSEANAADGADNAATATSKAGASKTQNIVASLPQATTRRPMQRMALTMRRLPHRKPGASKTRNIVASLPQASTRRQMQRMAFTMRLLLH